MTIKECAACHEDHEVDEMVEFQEFSDIYYCHECARDLENECPRCSGHGCSSCLMLEW